MATGWISLHRQIWDNELWHDKPFAKGQAWIDLLLLVNHEPRKIVRGKSVVFVGRGSTVTSIRELAERWGWSRHKVVDFLDLLQSAQMAKIIGDAKGTVVTIANYEHFQNVQTIKGHQRDTKGTQKGLNNNYNNVINKNSISLYSGEKSADAEKPVENSEAARIWNKVLDVLRAEYSTVAVETFFSDCYAEKWDGSKLHLWTANEYKSKIINDTYGGRIMAITDELRERGEIT